VTGTRTMPVALATWRAGGFDAKVGAARAELADCAACSRDCHVDRMAGEKGVCHVGRLARVASAFPHFGEEDCLRGTRGSGTIFFASCNLRCVFCQNWEISQRAVGPECTAAHIAGLMLELQARGCHNVNFVTPEHVAPQVVEAIAEAVPRGLRIPIVYNTSAYDGLGSLHLMEGLIGPGHAVHLLTFTHRARETGLVHSMGSVGECFDNAVVESFWARMQVELLNRRRSRTRIKLANAIFEHLEVFHNRQRRALRTRNAHPDRIRENLYDNHPIALQNQAS
jgi:hypothetical protein